VRKPVILAVNKVDSFGRDRAVAASEMFREKMAFRGVFLISALTGEGVPELLEALIGLLPFGPPLFPTDEMSDLPTRFFVSEIIREQVILLTGEEIPYKTAVEIMSFQEEAKIIRIHADIHTERDSQKKILIGKGGKMIKAIGVAARKKIEEFLGAKTHLELFVKVTPGWTKSDRILREFGY
jgi:GTP-binding protein Era